jgi:hypothetical protein
MAAVRGGSERTGVVLSAPAGVGKSRLARHAVEAAEREGALTSWVQATRSAAAVPLGALSGLVPADARSDEPLELMRRSAEALRERAGQRRVVLGVDDAQLLDPSSAALVLQLIMSGVAFVVATVRTGDPVPDAVQSLWKDAGAVRLELQPLGEHATATLVESVLGGPVEQRTQRRLYGTSRGNALYLRELLVGCLEDGALEQAGGIWRLARRPAPSASLTELVGARMEGLAADERRAIEYLALGEPLRMREIVTLAGDDAVAGAESHGLVAVEGVGDVRLAHPLYGEVVRASMPVVRAAATHRELARLVAERPDRDADDALRIARWLLDAGDPIPQPLLLGAARAATLAGDAELGARLAGLALDAGAGWRGALLLARAHAARNRNEEAEVVLAAIEGTIDDREAAIAYLEQRATVLSWGLERLGDALALLDRARAWWPDQAWLRELDPLRLHVVSLQDGFDGTLTKSVLSDPGSNRRRDGGPRSSTCSTCSTAARCGRPASCCSGGCRPSRCATSTTSSPASCGASSGSSPGGTWPPSRPGWAGRSRRRWKPATMPPPASPRRRWAAPPCWPAASPTPPAGIRRLAPTWSFMTPSTSSRPSTRPRSELPTTPGTMRPRPRRPSACVRRSATARWQTPILPT